MPNLFNNETSLPGKFSKWCINYPFFSFFYFVLFQESAFEPSVLWTCQSTHSCIRLLVPYVNIHYYHYYITCYRTTFCTKYLLLSLIYYLLQDKVLHQPLRKGVNPSSRGGALLYSKVVGNLYVIDPPFWHFHISLGPLFMPNSVLLTDSFCWKNGLFLSYLVLEIIGPKIGLIFTKNSFDSFDAFCSPWFSILLTPFFIVVRSFLIPHFNKTIDFYSFSPTEYLVKVLLISWRHLAHNM